MARQPEVARGPIALAERVIALLGEGRFTATYKYAVLLGLIDLCLEKTSRTGAAPDMVTTRELATKVVAIYWPHCAPFPLQPAAAVLRQSGGGRGSQAEIVAAIARFRRDAAPDPGAPLGRARAAAPEAFERLVREVEWKLIEMPLPRVQQLGSVHDPFLYEIGWDRDVRSAEVRRYQQDGGGDFDNRIRLLPGVGEHLVLLNGLLRPLIHREWAALVARMNGLEEARLERFLFGARRMALEPVRPGLQELQRGRCFYCDGLLQPRDGRRPHVDHFVPFARHPNDAIENLVVAHERCNGDKRDFLAAAEHVARWRERGAAELAEVAAHAGWETAPERSLGVARGIYLHLPPHVPLWLRGRDFAPVEPERLTAVLG
jgi:hypothetical protein